MKEHSNDYLFWKYIHHKQYIRHQDRSWCATPVSHQRAKCSNTKIAALYLLGVLCLHCSSSNFALDDVYIRSHSIKIAFSTMLIRLHSSFSVTFMLFLTRSELKFPICRLCTPAMPRHSNSVGKPVFSWKNSVDIVDNYLVCYCVACEA